MRGGAVPLMILAAVVLLGGGYSAYAANTVYQDFEHGRGELVSAQALLIGGPRSLDSGSIAAAMTRLRAAERAFADAQRQTSEDPALRVYDRLPGSRAQIEAAARLGQIGSDLSRAGENAATVASKLAALKAASALPLTGQDLLGLLQRAQALANDYQGSIRQIGIELAAAHEARAGVTTTGLLPPLQHAYDEVDRALEEADRAFARYQDVKQVLADFAGVQLSA